MKRKIVRKLLWPAGLLVLVGIMLVGGAGIAAAQGNTGPGFSYQGYLDDNGNPVNDTCTFAFGLFDRADGGNQIGATQEIRGVSVVEGSFAVVLNEDNQIGDDVFNGQSRWLEVTVDCGRGATTLGTRHELLAVPYAQSLRPGAVINGALPAQPVLDIHQTVPGEPALRVRGGEHQIGIVDTVNDGKTWTVSTNPVNQGMGVYENGTDNRFFIAAGGNVGLGTQVPQNRLTVRDNEHQIALVDANNGEKTWTLSTVNLGDGVGLYDDGQTNRLFIAEGGNVGIGEMNPGGRLHVTAEDGNTPDLVLGANDSGSSSTLGMISSDPAYPNSNIFLRSFGSISARLDTDNSGEDASFNVLDTLSNSLFRVDSDGNVGIGEANPQNPLSVRGPYHQIALIDEDNNDRTWTLSTVDHGNGIGVYENVDNQVPRLYIAHEGNVGVGTVNPQSRLHVNGDAIIAVNNQPRFVVEPDGEVCIGNC